MGADYVLNSNDSDLLEKVGKIQEEVGPTIGFDAVGGELSGAVFECMGESGIMHVYGALSGEKCNLISPLGLIFMGKKITSLNLMNWLDSKSTWVKSAIINEVLGLIDGPLSTEILNEIPISQVKEALHSFKETMGKGKVIMSHKFN